MGLLDSLAGSVGKAITKEVLNVASIPISIAINNRIDEKNEEFTHALMQSEEYPFKLLIKQRAYAISDKFKVYDEQRNVVYRVESEFFSTSPSITVYDSCGCKVGNLKKKALSLRSPFERYQGENVEFEVRVNGKKLGCLRNKKLGDWLDGFDKIFREVKDSFAGMRYEYDFVDWELLCKSMSFDYEIQEKDGSVIAKVDKNLWSQSDCYVIGYSCKENELLYLMMILAVDALADDRTKREWVSDSFWFGSDDDE
ncbi:LURP-one-related/scramblase family protein [Adlercreutzia sp. ZJ141]|uniref:LURP-one-related/scramblase family protein n=1 Tax=Adlercreutzia sp. ZJ141 TaxID=2709406 RepID=UPI0013ED3FD7|nr:LURP-one-related family protein [Adlercreutzia sp. ZJ141]